MEQNLVKLLESGDEELCRQLCIANDICFKNVLFQYINKAFHDKKNWQIYYNDPKNLYPIRYLFEPEGDKYLIQGIFRIVISFLDKIETRLINEYFTTFSSEEEIIKAILNKVLKLYFTNER
jgi:hypothetical protein